jgi:hypothetical protein
MATTVEEFRAQVEILLGPDDANTELNDAQLETIVKAAVERYSNDRPSNVIEDEVGDAGKYYGLVALLASWVEGFSRITKIEYPASAVSADTDPQYLSDEDWRDDYWAGGLRYLFLPNHAPAATETMRINYTAPYVWSGQPNQTTTPTQDFYAICNLAAGLSCQAIATKFSRTSDASIRADSVSHSTQAGEFSRRAKEFIALYEQHLGIGGDDGKPAFVPGTGAFIDFDTQPGWTPGRQFLFHDSRTR